MTNTEQTEQRHVILFGDREHGADQTVFFGTVSEARACCDRMVTDGEADWAMLEQDQ